MMVSSVEWSVFEYALKMLGVVAGRVVRALRRYVGRGVGCVTGVESQS